MTREERYKFIAKEIHFADWFMYFHLSFGEELHQALKEAEEIINDLSERKKGEWKYRKNGWARSGFGDGELYKWKCSKCKGVAKQAFSFCPFCGTDMRGEE